MIRGREQRKDKARRKQNNDIPGKLGSEKGYLGTRKECQLAAWVPRKAAGKKR